MLKLREDAIKMQEKTEKKLLKQMFRSEKYSPRTYEKKRRDLEVWVKKEKEEVKKTRKIFEEEWHKTQKIIQITQENQLNIKKLIGESSTHRSKHTEHLPSQGDASNRVIEKHESVSYLE